MSCISPTTALDNLSKQSPDFEGEQKQISPRSQSPALEKVTVKEKSLQQSSSENETSLSSQSPDIEAAINENLSQNSSDTKNEKEEEIQVFRLVFTDSWDD